MQDVFVLSVGGVHTLLDSNPKQDVAVEDATAPVVKFLEAALGNLQTLLPLFRLSSEVRLNFELQFELISCAKLVTAFAGSGTVPIFK